MGPFCSSSYQIDMLQVTQIPSGLFLLKIVSSFLFSYNLRTLEEDIHFHQIAFTSWPLFHLLLSNYLQDYWMYFLQTRPISFCKAKTICNNYVESSDITLSHLLLLKTYLLDKKDLNQALLKSSLPYRRRDGPLEANNGRGSKADAGENKTFRISR